MTLVSRSVPSPLGALLLVGDGERLRALHVNDAQGAAPPGATTDDAAFPEAVHQLDEWFAGRRQAFDLPLDLHGTAWQQRVWEVLLEIPFGATVSYGEVARRAGQPGAARAVGHAVGRNPVAIVVPCHRVVATNGLGGYTGGLDVKRWLLAHEGSPRSRPQRTLFTGRP